MRDIGKNIKDLRIANGLTQDQLAEKLFVTRQTVSNYENGKSRPDIDTIVKLSEVLGCDVDSILYGTAKTDNSEKIRFAVGCALLLAVVITILYLEPKVMEIKRMHYISSFMFFGALTLTPLKYLILGWTAMQLGVIAFKIKVRRFNWRKHLKCILITLVVLYFVIIMWFWLPYVICDLKYIIQISQSSYNVSYTYPEISTPALIEWLHSKIAYIMLYNTGDMRIPVFLCLGAILRLCGFAEGKNNIAVKKHN